MESKMKCLATTTGDSIRKIYDNVSGESNSSWTNPISTHGGCHACKETKDHSKKPHKFCWVCAIAQWGSHVQQASCSCNIKWPRRSNVVCNRERTWDCKFTWCQSWNDGCYIQMLSKEDTKMWGNYSRKNPKCPVINKMKRLHCIVLHGGATQIWWNFSLIEEQRHKDVMKLPTKYIDLKL